MRRISWILGIGAALVMACGVEPPPSSTSEETAASQDQLEIRAADDLSSGVNPNNLDESRCSLIPKPWEGCVCAGPNRWLCPEPTTHVFCPALPPECCGVKIVSGCRICTQIGC